MSLSPVTRSEVDEVVNIVKRVSTDMPNSKSELASLDAAVKKQLSNTIDREVTKLLNSMSQPKQEAEKEQVQTRGKRI